MSEFGYERKNGIIVARFMNFTRFFLYISAALIQFNLLTNQIILRNSADWLLVLVPLSLGSWDLLMALWKGYSSSFFWKISFVAPIISLAIAIHTMIPLISLTSPIIAEVVMFCLSLGVVMVSIIELYALYQFAFGYMNKPYLKQVVDETRTYEV
ncbi:hypothetical protein EU527_12395 [Candidatus Thorarchaeota archaeon]|nr:MAG: hypothetical protein EU527_12395 [Candidatus Thorarchaeota archaeon]